jgi:hypothetical protein
MVPPSLSNGPRDKRMTALRHWKVIHTFDAEKMQRLRLSKFNPGLYRGMPPEEIYDVQCVASDDPRLKEK